MGSFFTLAKMSGAFLDFSCYWGIVSR
jgi:hypothetical protein